MNGKKVNWLFLTMIIVHFAVVGILTVFHGEIAFGIVKNMLVSELIIAVPAALFLLCPKGDKAAVLSFRRIKITSVFMTVLFAYLTMPLTTVINAISMMFVDNAVLEMSGDVLSMPFFLMFIMMALYGPFMEEFVFRGVVYGGYRKSGTKLQAILLSALLFGLIHMNFNQAPYAFVLGVVMALLVEATGSIWAPIIFHAVFNGNSVCLMYLTKDFLAEEAVKQSAAQAGSDEWIIVLCVYMVMAAVSTSIAACVLAWIARNEGRTEALKAIWSDRKNTKEKMLTVPFIVGIVLCLAFMIFTTVILGA